MRKMNLVIYFFWSWTNLVQSGSGSWILTPLFSSWSWCARLWINKYCWWFDFRTKTQKRNQKIKAKVMHWCQGNMLYLSVICRGDTMPKWLICWKIEKFSKQIVGFLFRFFSFIDYYQGYLLGGSRKIFENRLVPETDQDREKFQNLGPNRTRTNKILKISDRVGPAGTRTWRSVDPCPWQCVTNTPDTEWQGPSGYK